MKHSNEIQAVFNHIRGLTGWGVAFTITPLVYQGVITGSEFEAYNVNKLYVASVLKIAQTAAVDAAIPYITVIDESNAAMVNYNDKSILHDGANVLYSGLIVNLENFYFSRLSLVRYNNIQFIGYRLNKT